MLFDENSGSGFYLSVFASYAAKLGCDSIIFPFCFFLGEICSLSLSKIQNGTVE